jgi:hypothetical protein
MRKPNKILLAPLCLATVIGMTTLMPSFAQQSKLVKVDIKNIAAKVAKNINVEDSQIPLVVQAPVAVAAHACGVAANVLGQQEDGSGGCTATTTSPALEQIVQRQVKANKQK